MIRPGKSGSLVGRRGKGQTSKTEYPANQSSSLTIWGGTEVSEMPIRAE